MTFLKIENYCENVPEIRNGLPVTTKSNPSEHGYGMRSIQSAVQRYDGEFRILAEGHIFTLTVILPNPGQ